MTKTIKLEDKVHQELEILRLKRETFSQTVERLITFYRDINRVIWSQPGALSRIPDQER